MSLRRRLMALAVIAFAMIALFPSPLGVLEDGRSAGPPLIGTQVPAHVAFVAKERGKLQLAGIHLAALCEGVCPILASASSHPLRPGDGIPVRARAMRQNGSRGPPQLLSSI